MAKSKFSSILNGPILNLPSFYQNHQPRFTASSSTNVNAFYTVAGQPPNTVGHPHILKIFNHNEDVGQDGYIEDYDWEVFHPIECEKQTITMDMLSRGVIPLESQRRDVMYQTEYIHVCEMAKELEQYGLERLSTPWLDLEVGEYNIVLEESAGGYDNTGMMVNPPTYRIMLL